jgi:hypothetical protein
MFRILISLKAIMGIAITVSPPYQTRDGGILVSHREYGLSVLLNSCSQLPSQAGGGMVTDGQEKLTLCHTFVDVCLIDISRVTLP